MAYFLLAIGFFLLVKGADLFVSGSSGLAKRLGIPSIVIGMTIVAFGTSAPEAAVSITAAIQGNNGIAVGNVLGSNIFNILVVVGVAAVIRPVHIHEGILKKDLPYSILVTAALLFMGMDILLDGQTAGLISRSDGLVLLAFMAVFLFYTLCSSRAVKEETLPLEEIRLPKPPVGKSLLSTGVGLAFVIVGGQLVVDSATEIALSFGISQSLIGLTIVAIGTSLPELVTSAVAAKQGESDIAMGNVIGSNIFNILSILAVSSVISPLGFSKDSVWDAVLLIAISLMVYGFCLRKKEIGRKTGVFFILLYCLYTGYIILR